MTDAPAERTTALVLPLADAHASAERGGAAELLEWPDVRVVIVGPSDAGDSREWVRNLTASQPGRCAFLPVTAATGQAEAVRAGLRFAAAGGARVVGYVTDDFATPPSEIVRLRDVMLARDALVVLGARVAMLGSDIRRSAVRHYLGRAFAMAASGVLRTAIYDTQCGVKLFRPSPALTAALASPFLSTVAFDVELLGRLLVGGPGAPAVTKREIVEVPLKVWNGGGPWLGPSRALIAARDLRRIAADLGVRRTRPADQR